MSPETKLKKELAKVKEGQMSLDTISYNVAKSGNLLV